MGMALTPQKLGNTFLLPKFPRPNPINLLKLIHNAHNTFLKYPQRFLK